ncbi:HAD family hydrolase [Mucilaginibacter polytrichastri]|uniref:Putative pseudouridine-5'-monophosphatase n=1 Tax=Mucilaginibacter polytrichastri TaxID=1302689 RepID=A0A1Q5ZX44_9SPHI|nr:HAD family phosphatase [Mucilaginibacter polytrichastri]OKS86298.1 putative pseudouridine-5'-monophosphatase [Mucilaginibacter polytrichastri]SFT16727.1 haloacid dehalogenase superfamily, subfamily IA, variant 3 with third motif having DD or ED/haloacid dehalogenase superfamily, subfamily IA, variant 1 with third motif having Dx(3-4)D or Dx(3-4)E [Mucilaginibacter polytrichastri]
MINTDITTGKLEALTNLSQGFKAYLYDCDGTLADNMGAHKETYIKVAADKGFVLNADIVDELAGWPTVKVIEEINKRYGTSFDPQEFNDLKYKLYLDEYINHIKPIEFVVNHLKAHAGKVKIGVVSGGSRESIQKTLQILGIDSLVEVMVCAGETVKGKPYPDPFLAAAEQLGIAPADCLVFEDGAPGVTAAEAAGMKWIRIDKL